MNTRHLMDQLLKAGNEMFNNTGAAMPQTSGQPDAPQGGQSPLNGLLAGAGGGALAAGALGLLLGSKKGRKIGAKVATYGGLAAVGVVAYKAYDNWQKNQGVANATPPQTVDRLPAPEAEQHSRAILLAIIGAAKADGHVDDRERALIDQEIARLGADDALQRWFDDQLRQPLDPARVAAAASTPEMAAEMYLASALVVDEESFMERAYLQELVKQLRLDPALVSELDTQARAAAG